MPSFDGTHRVYANDVQYPYADIGKSSLIHISSVNESNRRQYKFFCPGCHFELSPRLGSKKRPCFAHRPGEVCDRDTYIHSTAELLLKKKWDEDGPFEISYRVTSSCSAIASCLFSQKVFSRCTKEETIRINLKEQFSRCEIEKKIGGLIPDLCLIDDSGRNEPLFIEIWHTHKSSDDKIKSGKRIIEIRLNSMEELEQLPMGPIQESESVCFYNFDRKKLVEPCDDFLTRRKAQEMLKKKWDENGHFEIIKNNRTECENISTCPFETYGFCRYDEMNSYDLKQYYTQCVVDYSDGGECFDIGLIDGSGKNPPLLIELNPNCQKSTHHREICILAGSSDEYKRILSSPLEESACVIFKKFRIKTFPPDEDSGPNLVRYTLSSNLKYEWEGPIHCVNLKNTRMKPNIVFEIVCRQEDFQKLDDFIRNCNHLAARYEIIGYSRKFSHGYTSHELFRISPYDCPRYCRFYNSNGVLTEEVKRFHADSQFNPPLPEPKNW